MSKTIENKLGRVITGIDSTGTPDLITLNAGEHSPSTNSGQAIQRIAVILGAHAQWSNPADLLDAICAQVVACGLPDPSAYRTVALWRELADALDIEHDGPQARV